MALIESPSVTVSPPTPEGTPGRVPERTVVWLHGDQDLSNVAALSESLARAIALDDADLIVDLSGVEFMGAGTVGVIVRAREFMTVRSRSISLRAATRRGRLVFDACGLGSLLDPIAFATGALSTWVAVPSTNRTGGDA